MTTETTRAHILVVDDNKMNREMLGRRLERKGFKIHGAEDGAEALAMIDAQVFDLVLLDIMMPGISGLEALSIVRKRYTQTDLPIIMATAKDESEDIVSALQMGANDYVTKPIDFPVLLARLETHLSLRQLSRQKDEFLAIASHDLKNPLTAIAGSASLLKDFVQPGTAMTESMYGMVLAIVRRTKTMQHIIEDFLDFQAVQAGRIVLERELADLNEITLEVIGNQAEYAANKKIELVTELADSLPKFSFDPSRISQVIENLVGNAIKFSEAGTRVDGDSVKCEVSDLGPGLKEDDMNKLFTRYARLSNQPTGGEKSSGLGLAICKQMIELHGGQIGARNNAGSSGTTFWFKLPA